MIDYPYHDTPSPRVSYAETDSRRRLCSDTTWKVFIQKQVEGIQVSQYSRNQVQMFTSRKFFSVWVHPLLSLWTLCLSLIHKRHASQSSGLETQQANNEKWRNYKRSINNMTYLTINNAAFRLVVRETQMPIPLLRHCNGSIHRIHR